MFEDKNSIAKFCLVQKRCNIAVRVDLEYEICCVKNKSEFY